MLLLTKFHFFKYENPVHYQKLFSEITWFTSDIVDNGCDTIC